MCGCGAVFPSHPQSVLSHLTAATVCTGNEQTRNVGAGYCRECNANSDCPTGQLCSPEFICEYRARTSWIAREVYNSDSIILAIIIMTIRDYFQDPQQPATRASLMRTATRKRHVSSVWRTCAGAELAAARKDQQRCRNTTVRAGRVLFSIGTPRALIGQFH